MDRRSLLRMLALASGYAALGGCGSSGKSGDSSRIASDLPRNTSPVVPAGDLAALVAGNTRFALNLYGTQSRSGNLFFSPYSVSLALAMAYAGAAGNTATQMAAALGYDLPAARLHPAFDALDLALAAREAGQNGNQGFRLRVANAIWGQRGETFQSAFLDTLAVNYGAGMRVVDYQANAEAARGTINQWVSDQTADRINNLLPPGAVTTLTRLVLTNAIYFLAPWATPFEVAQTADRSFTTLAGVSVTVTFMNQRQALPYAAGDGWRAVELPYAGEQLSLLLLVPDAGRFAAVENALDAARLTAILGGLRNTDVSLALPKFKVESSLPLSAALQSLGMTDAFDGSLADLSGIDGRRDLAISDVLHKAYVRIDETGTEAAAATAVVIGATSAPGDHVTLTIDRPFLLVLRDRPTGAVLFLGRVADPSA
ncbi:MAG: serpin family protein [Armatimonadetes bacterium]|nr:serpin family protein [Armatimonadota bacterium]